MSDQPPPYGDPQPPGPGPAPGSIPPPPTWGQPEQQPQQQPPYSYPLPQGYARPAPTEGLAVASMVIGIVSLVLACGYGIGLLGSPAALVMGRISMKRIDRSNGQLGGRGMAQAGFILGIIGTVLLAITLIALVVILVVAVGGGFDSYSG